MEIHSDLKRTYENSAHSDSSDSVSEEPERKMRKLNEDMKSEEIPKLTDPRFEHFRDGMEDAKPALAINLYNDGFSFDSQQGAQYSYDSNTRGLIKCIDCRRLPPDLVELLDGIPNVYYDGCMCIEIRDYRNRASIGKPTVHKVVLRPDTESVINDIQQLSTKAQKRWTADDFIQAEEKIMQANLPTICLDPSPQVAYIANIMHYNSLKFNIKPREKVAVSASETAIPEDNASSAKSVQSTGIPLLNFLKQREKAPSEEPNPFASQVHQIVNKIINTQMTTSKPPEPSTNQAATLNNRRMRFHLNGGKAFVTFVITMVKPSSYEATLRVGKTPDNGTNGEAVLVPLGNASTALDFVSQMKTLYEKEGIGILVHDSTDPILSSTAQAVQMQILNNPPQPQAVIPMANNMGIPLPLQIQKKEMMEMPGTHTIFGPQGATIQIPSAQQAQQIAQQYQNVKKRNVPTNPVGKSAARMGRGMEVQGGMTPISPTLPIGATVPPDQRRPATDLLGFWSRLSSQQPVNAQPTENPPQV